MNRRPMMTRVWPRLVKAQARALQIELKALGLDLALTRALEVRTHLAGQPYWNLYNHALNTGQATVNPLVGLENRFLHHLQQQHLSLSFEAAQQLLRRMDASGLHVFQEALLACRGHLTLYPVTGTALNLRVLERQLVAVDESEILSDLEQARPQITGLFEEPALLPLLVTLCEQEGPGVLAALHTPESITWAYLRDERQALLFVLAQATLPKIISGQPLDFSWSRALQRRTALSSLPVPTAPQAPIGRFSWARLWRHGEGLKQRLAQLEARLPAGFLFGASLPATLTPTEAHLAFWDALEGVALQARQAPGPLLDWPATLQEGTLRTLQQALSAEVQAVLSDRRTRFPAAAQADIRVAVAAGLPVPTLLSELDVLLEDEQWHARRRVWQKLDDLRQVQVGDTLCVNRGRPFQVQAVEGIQDFTLSVVDQQGRPQAIRHRDRLERQIDAQLEPDF